MFNYLQKKGFLFACLCLGLSPLTVYSQACAGQEGALPDTPVEVGGGGSVAGNPEVTCFYFRFDSDITGWPTGITMDLWHEYEGDLGIFIEACGERLNVLQRPGAVGNCDPECAFNIPGGDCGSSAMIGTEGNPEVITFYDTGTEPDDGISMGGNFGLTLDDACGVGTVSSFTELWSNCPEGLVEAEICFADHASLHRGFVSNLNFIFPNPYICGCLDPDALNYNENASVSSGDCIYECEDWIVEVETPAFDLCQGVDTLFLSASAPEADNPSFQWIGTGISNDFLEAPESAQTAVYLPTDFTGTIIYTVTATDEYLCPQSEDVLITVSPAATVTIDGPATICGSDSTDLTLTGGPYNSIQWSTGAQTESIRAGAGTYEVTVTAPGLCPASDLFTVTAFALPEPAISGPDTICFTDTVQLNADTNFVSYSWSTGDTLAMIQVNQPSLYSLVIVDSNGCTGVDTFQLSHFDSLKLVLPDTAAFCPGDNISLQAPPDLFAYQWSNGDTTAQTIVSTAGPLSLTAVDSLGCSLTQEVEVEALVAPQPEIIGPPALCPNETVELATAINYPTYAWSDGEQDSILTTNQVGTYSVVVTDEFGCTGTGSYLLEEATIIDLELQSPTAICPEEEASLIATSGFASYEWSTGDSTAIISVPGPGDYQLTVTSQEGCVQTTAASIAPFTPIIPAIAGDNALCPGESTTLIVNGNYSDHVWGDGTLGPQLSVSAAGIYEVQATDSNGCAVIASYEVQSLAPPTVSITGDTQICDNGTGILQATPGLSSYSWSVAGETGADLSLSAPGTYSLTVTDEDGCTNTTSASVVLSIPQPEILGENTFCDGASTVLMVADTFNTYQWSGGGAPQNNMLTVDEPGTYILTVTDALGCEAITTVGVIENPLPEPVIGGDQAFCNGESTILDAGSGYQNYEWSVPGNTTQFLNVSTESDFSVTVTDTNGCVGSASVSTQVNPLPDPQISGDLLFCPGDETQLTSTEEFVSYSWSNGSTDPSTIVSTSEVITLTVVDSNACVGIAVAQPEFFALNAPQIVGELNLCQGGSTTLTANSGFVSYQWSDGQVGPAATFAAAGLVTLTVVDSNSCVTEQQALLDNYPVEPLTVVSTAGFCAGETADLTAQGNFLSFQWSNQDSTATTTIAEAGLYTVTATDANGCTAVAEGTAVEYDLPEPEIDGLSRFCVGFSTTLSTSQDYPEYLWSTNSTMPEISVASAGPVSVTVTDSNGCVGATTTVLETVAELDPVVIAPAGFCPGESAALTVEEPYESYTWSTGSVEASITVTTEGTYTVTVTAAGGCSGETEVQVAAFANPEVIISGQDSFCSGESVQLIATGDIGELVWNTASNEAEIWVDQAGEYTVLLRDANGCTAEDQIELIELPLPEFAVAGDTTFCAGLNTTLSTTPVFPTYEWSSGSAQPTITLSESTNVSVTVTDDNGCSAIRATAVSEIALPIADAGNPADLDCDTESVTLGGQGSSNGATSFYAWTGPGISPANQNEPFPVVAEAGTYSLQLTDLVNNCVSPVSTVQVNDLSYTPVAIVTALDTLDCNSSSVTINGNGSDTGPQYVYEWQDANQEPILNATGLQLAVSEAQQYTLLVRDTVTACVGMASATVSIDTVYPSIVLPTPAELTCTLTETTVSALVTSSNLVDLRWTEGAGADILSDLSAATVQVGAPGWYWLEVADLANGCVSIDSILVTQNTSAPSAVTNGDQLLLCDDENVTLNGQGSSNGTTISYQWLYNGTEILGANTLQYAAVEPGFYTLIVTDESNGCTADEALEVSLDPTAPRLFTVEFDPPTCQGDQDASVWVSNIEGGASPYLYSFNGQAFTAITNYGGLPAGAYELTVEDANGCRLTAEVNIPDGNDLTLYLGPDQEIEEGDPASIYPQVSIDSASISRLDWNVAFDLPCPDCLIQEDLFLTQSTRFFLTVTDENGCTAKDDLLILLTKDENIYVPNAFSPNGDGRNDFFTIYSKVNSVEEIEVMRIFNRWGEFVWENTNFQPNDPAMGWDGRIGTDVPNPAVYVWYAEIKMRSGETRLMKGDVTLVE